MVVRAGSIVEHLNVINGIGPGQIACPADAFLNPFFLQNTKESFRDNIAPAVPVSTHVGLKIVGLQEPQPVIAALMRALFRLQHGLPGQAPSPIDYDQRIPRQLRRQPWLH